MKKQLVLTFTLSLTIINCNSQINWVKGGNNAGPPGSQPIIGTNNIWNSSLQFHTFGIQRMIIRDNNAPTPGFVGIGANFLTPNNLLDVNGGDIDVNTPQRSYMIADQSVLWHKGGTANIFVGVGAGNA